MLKYDIIIFLNNHPELTYYGIEWNQNNSDYKEKRVEIFENLDEIVKCMDWLDRFYVPSNREKDETNSYALKHYVENYTSQYISNGAFVVAVLMKNHKHKVVKDNPNVFIRLQSKPLDEHKILYSRRNN